MAARVAILLVTSITPANRMLKRLFRAAECGFGRERISRRAKKLTTTTARSISRESLSPWAVDAKGVASNPKHPGRMENESAVETLCPRDQALLCLFRFRVIAFTRTHAQPGLGRNSNRYAAESVTAGLIIRVV